MLSPVNLDTAIELLSLPDRIRGYGPVKEKAVQEAKTRYAQLAADLVSPRRRRARSQRSRVLTLMGARRGQSGPLLFT